MSVPDELLTENDAAKLLNIPIRTLQTWRFQKRVLPFTKVGKAVRYSRAKLEKFVADNTVSVDGGKA